MLLTGTEAVAVCVPVSGGEVVVLEAVLVTVLVNEPVPEDVPVLVALSGAVAIWVAVLL
jgi:hypothetical protein